MILSLFQTFCTQLNSFVSSGKSRYKDLVLKILLLLRSCRWMAYHYILFLCITFTNGKIKCLWGFNFSDCLHLHPGFKAATWSLWLARLEKRAVYSHPGSLQALLISPFHFCRLRISWVSLDTLKKDSSGDSSDNIWCCCFRKQPCLFQSFLMHHP